MLEHTSLVRPENLNPNYSLNPKTRGFGPLFYLLWGSGRPVSAINPEGMLGVSSKTGPQGFIFRV